MILLDRIKSPADLKKLSREELAALAGEMRARLIDVCDNRDLVPTSLLAYIRPVGCRFVVLYEQPHRESLHELV